ncbi:MAG: glycosyltransferase family 2 protein [Clostridia bacterium]|nr:glycosyltransferase family 2 protein [Clostridia bacterium]
MIFVEILSWVNVIISALFMICYAYQAVYLAFSLLKKPKTFPVGKLHRYGVLIAARNEETVIGQLIESVKTQTYPSELVEIFVVADNCTDGTADAARAAGASVFEREDKIRVGKGYALHDLLDYICKERGENAFDGFFVFDADNILDARFIEEMNKVFDAGYEVVTSYRNSKNFGDNWLSAGYGLFFLREATQLNRPRMMLNTSACVSGTGFLFSNAIAKRNHGWKHYLLTEDFEFTVDCVLHGQKVAYCESAVIYDEQPTQFGPSFLQRARWIRGYLQVFGRYGLQMLKKMFRDRDFSCFDMIMNNIPCLVLTCLTILSNAVMLLACAFSRAADMGQGLLSMATGILFASCTLWFVGGLTCVTQRRQIRASKGKMLLGVLVFPFFIFTFALSMLAAIFGRVEWKPIRHSVTLSAKELRGMRQKDT